MRNVLYYLAFFAALHLFPSTRTVAQDAVGENASEEAWEVTRELLYRREYAIAVDFLEGLADDPTNAENAEAIQTDIKAVSGLRTYSDSVETVIKSLKENDEFTDDSNKYLFLRYEKTTDGHSIIVKTEAGQEQALTTQQFQSKTWLDLAGRSEDPVPDELTVGIFLAFDKDTDLVAARAKLDLAASHGQDVKIWLERANRIATEPDDQKELPSTVEPIVGNWFVRFDKRKISFVTAFLPDGRVTGIGETWEKGDDGYYHVNFARKGTANVLVLGNRFFGKFPSGVIVKGVR